MKSVKKLKPTGRWSLQDNDSKQASDFTMKYSIKSKHYLLGSLQPHILNMIDNLWVT